MLKTEYIRDGRNQIMGSVTTGFANGDTLARDRDGRIRGHSSDLFDNTRDGDGRLVSRDVSDVGLLFRRR